ncbi:MAG TPA: hypothetical protein VGS23_07205 [Thermoplasmata archaeon]|nr:hypothetical protein [Thermoplasmata archaeon]
MKAIDWLLGADQPSIRFRTLTEILGRARSDPEAAEARAQIPSMGWAHEILKERRTGVGWADGSSQYRPKYVSTHWRMLVLADLGLTRVDPGMGELCEFWMRGFAARGGRLGGNTKGTPHYCVAANMARALIQFGFEEDPRVVRTLAWLAEIADPKGGWSCFSLGRNLDSWEALSAFAVYPKAKWTPRMREAVDSGAEFYLERELHRQGARYAPWFRLHYPVHYYYDLLVGLDFLTALGHSEDPRLRFALDHLRKRRRRDGRWILDAVHPDVGPGMKARYRAHPKERPIPWAIETPGRPSKMITLTALRVLARVGALKES